MSDVNLMADELSYDDIVELIVDADDTTTPWAPYQERKILLALRELQQRRIDERVANNLAAVADLEETTHERAGCYTNGDPR